jgi:patatin-related protein
MTTTGSGGGQGNPSLSATCLFQPVQEVRFAVVMYGGVSLAIYMNGIAQELLRLVRATAPASPLRDTPDRSLLTDTELTGTLAVYRKLGRLLNGDKARAADLAPADPIRTRFVVDVVSGTSAGGINGVFLAKALANNQPVDQLTELWKSEADISRLINDAASAREQPGLETQRPPQSLLNSQRMYRQLLLALEGMERKGRSSPESRSPLVEELDLFVTATDLTGLTLPLQLGDVVAYERRHRNVFHFLYATAEATGDDRNDFQADNNPFLAFAARCTSAFPVAFEPMCLRDIDAVLDAHPFYGTRRDLRSNGAAWDAFIKDYRRDDTVPFAERSFGDGGYLDNKPFSYATETLLRRRADQPVDRKLIFIEPSPEHPEEEPGLAEKPDAIRNAVQALLVLPRHETIREDLERVRARNRLLAWIARVLFGNEQDVERQYAEGRPPVRRRTEWGDTDLADMLEEKGVSYGIYHRLKIIALMEDLAALIARVAGFDENSDEFQAIRHLVRVWRAETYTLYRDGARPTENRLLIDFDLRYRLRRLNFLLSKIDELIPLDAHARDVMRWAGVAPADQPAGEAKAAFIEELGRIRRGLNRAFVLLRQRGRQLRARGAAAASPLGPAVQALGITAADLARILEERTEARQLAVAREIHRAHAEPFGRLAVELAGHLRLVFEESSTLCTSAVKPIDADRTAARRCLWHFYEHFDDYDLITFPLIYGTDLGEANTVEIIRISPEDAPSLIDERHSARRKLAGTALFHFGAFLERLWRENDILWGRLDATERLLTALLPDDHPLAGERAGLLEEAQRAIIAEEVRREDMDRICGLLADALAKLDPQTPTDQALRELVAQEFGSPINPKLQAVLRTCLTGEQMLGFLRSGYTVNRDLSGPSTARNLGRATRVMGQLLEGLADTYRVSKKPVAWIAWLGTVVCGLVEVSIPQRLPEMFWRHWLKVLYLFEAVLIAGGWAFGLGETQRLGWWGLAVTAGAHLATTWLRSRMKRAEGSRTKSSAKEVSSRR